MHTKGLLLYPKATSLGSFQLPSELAPVRFFLTLTTYPAPIPKVVQLY